MKVVLKVVGGLVAAFVLLMVVQLIASESGEVVVVESMDDQGQPQETRLWVVDHDGHAWLRSGSPEAGWYQRMMANPKVKVTRGEQAFNAVVDAQPEQRKIVNDLMLEKYAWADQLIALLFGRDDAIPLRLNVSQ